MNGLFPGARAAWRQRGHLPAFRIADPQWDEPQRAAVEQALAVLRDTPAPPAPPEADSAPPEADAAALADAATQLWLAVGRLAREGRDCLPARQAGHYLRSCTDALAASGLVVQAHDGTAYHPGLAMTVLEWEVHDELDRDQVVRTVRPTVYLHGRAVQMAQVIVGGPREKEEDDDG